jgi:hypothetical protein
VASHQFLGTNGIDRLRATGAFRGFGSRFRFWFVLFLDLIVCFADIQSHGTTVGAGANAGRHFRPLNGFVEFGLPCGRLKLRCEG